MSLFFNGGDSQTIVFRTGLTIVGDGTATLPILACKKYNTKDLFMSSGLLQACDATRIGGV